MLWYKIDLNFIVPGGSSPDPWIEPTQAIRSLEMMLDELLAEAARRPGSPWSPWSPGNGI